MPIRTLRGRKTLVALLLLDGAATLAVFNFIGHLRGVVDSVVLWPLAVPLLAVTFALYLIDGYRVRTDMISLDYTSLHWIALTCAMLVTLLLTYAVFPWGYELQSSRVVIALSFLILIPVTLSYRRVQYQRHLAQWSGNSLVFLGSREACARFREECQAMGSWQPVIHSIAGELAGAEHGALYRPLGEVFEAVDEGRLALEGIVLGDAAERLGPEVAQRLVHLHFRGIPTRTLDQFYQHYWQKVPVRGIKPVWLFQEGFQIAREPVFERLKRATDILLSAVGLLAAAPFLALGALAILAEDGRPVFFRQNRVGQNGAVFRLHKLRTMRHEPEAAGDRYTQPGDRRITRVGRLLRASRLDELPQLWNVLRGDMSLIGPRAEWDRLVQEYEREIPCYHFRHLVKPGITGWAQVNYPYGANLEDTVRKLEYDLYYIQNFSFSLDASIVLKTIHVMLLRKGR